MTRRMPRLLAAAAVLGLISAPPAHAGLSDLEDAIVDGVVDGFKEAWDTWLESIKDWLFRPQVNMPMPGEEIHGIAGVIGHGDNSYLGPDGPDLAVLYPPEPDLRTVDDGEAYLLQREQDRRARVEEAMQTAATITTALPEAAARLEVLTALNRSPVSILGAAQLGAEASLEVARALHAQNGLIAELGQLQADEAAKQDWDRRAYDAWWSAHNPDGQWQGTRRFVADRLELPF